eukprot:1935597-Prymnesium_polylepis.2
MGRRCVCRMYSTLLLRTTAFLLLYSESQSASAAEGEVGRGHSAHRMYGTFATRCDIDAKVEVVTRRCGEMTCTCVSFGARNDGQHAAACV